MASALAIGRISAEMRAYYASNPTDIRIYVDERNIFNVYGLLIGPADTPFAGGTYVVHLDMPEDYPHSAPKVTLMTPNGRYNTGEELCFSFTARFNRSVMHTKHVGEGSAWGPSWGIEAVLRALLMYVVEPPPASDGPVIALMNSSDKKIGEYAAESIVYNQTNIPFYKEFFEIPAAYVKTQVAKTMTAMSKMELATDADGDFIYSSEEES